jgi:GTP-binding protein
MFVEATFVRSAASAADLPRDGLAEIALVGRSNVGKSSLINALVRRRIARTSSAPGKTRLANIYRIGRGSGTALYLVDLPGYGYARGDRADIDEVVRTYFGPDRQERQERSARRGIGPASRAPVSALLLIDSRHPGLQGDIDAWAWLQSTLDHVAIVATKIDKLSRAERLRATATNEAVFEHPVLPVSAETGEGLEDLWKLIERLTTHA